MIVDGLARASRCGPVLLLAAVLGGCSDEPSADVEVVAVRDRGRLETSAAIRGRDGGYSARIFDRSVWVYGDTVLAAEGDDGSTWRHNTWSYTDDERADDGLTGFVEPVDTVGAPLELFPKTAAEQAFLDAHSGDPCEVSPCGAREVLWPGPLVWDTEEQRALAFFGKIHGEPGAFNFYSVGCGVATWDTFDAGPRRHEVRPGREHPTLLWDADGGSCVSGAWIDEGWLYAWACGGDLEKACQLGRVAPADVLTPEAWRWFADDAWVSSRADADDLFSGMDMTSVHFNEGLGRFVAVYSQPLGSEVMLRTATRPEGPWTEPIVLFDAEPSHDGAVAYSGLAHGDFTSSDGLTEYVTYFRSPAAWEGELRLMEIELAPR